MVEVLFWLFIFLVCYTYLIYPVILWVMTKFINKPVNKKDITPTVSLLITAYNEEKGIRQKLEDSLELDYPKDKLEILVASDCSSDRTDDIVKEFEDRGVRLYRINKRRGKTAAQNNAVAAATGDILVFSDATTKYKPDVIRKLVRNFNDEEVGCVSGDLIYTTDQDEIMGEGGKLYWNYESWIKQMESSLGAILGATGCIYAMRKVLYRPFHEDDISDFVSPMKLIIEKSNLDDDFLNPMKIYVRGIRSVMEPEAISYEKTTNNLKEEFKMRSRVMTRALSGLMHFAKILDPFKYPQYSFQLISHKIFKWLIPVFMTMIFLSNVFLLENAFYAFTFSVQLLFYLFAFVGWVLHVMELWKIKIFYIPYYFCLVNAAILVGILRNIGGKKEGIWTPKR